MGMFTSPQTKCRRLLTCSLPARILHHPRLNRRHSAQFRRHRLARFGLGFHLRCVSGAILLHGHLPVASRQDQEASGC